MAAPAHGTPPMLSPPMLSPTAFVQLLDQSEAWIVDNYARIAVACAVAAVLVAAILGLRMMGERLCRRTGWHKHWPVTIGRVMARTTGWFAVIFAAKLVDGYADAPAMVARTVDVLFTVAAALQGALWVRELILSMVEHRAGDEHAGLASAIGIIRILVTIVLFAVATVAILDNLGVNVTGLVAGLGIGGIAIGLAAKGIFDDLFSALSILFDKPFQRGDAISWDSTSGTVETIGLKTTRVRAVTGEEVVISNTNLLGKELHNLARLDRRRIVTTIGIAYYTAPDLCARVPAMAKEIVEAQHKCTLVRCGLVAFGASSLDFELQYDVHSDLYDEVFEARHRVSVAILAAFNAASIDFAWPTQMSIPAGADGRPMMPSPVAAPPAAGEPPSFPPAPTSTEYAPE